jgi:hypothetical protein
MSSTRRCAGKVLENRESAQSAKLPFQGFVPGQESTFAIEEISYRPKK